MISPEDTQYIERRARHLVARHNILAGESIGWLVHMFLNQPRAVSTASTYRHNLIMFLRFVEQELGHTLPEDITSLWLPFFVAQASPKHKNILSYKPPAVILELVTSEILDKFVYLRRQEGDREEVIKSRISAVRRLFQFAFDSGVITFNLRYVFISNPQKPKATRPGRILTTREIQQLRGVVDTSNIVGKRDLAILDCMLLIGMSPREIAFLKMGSFFFKEDYLWIKPPIESRRRKFIFVPTPLHQRLLMWFYEAGLTWSLRELPAFFSISGTNVEESAISTRTICRLVAVYGARADLTPRFGPDRLTHLVLRMTAVRHAYDEGVPLEKAHFVAGVCPWSIDAYLGIEFSELDLAPAIPDTWQ